jgi:hypothetical protein
MSLTTEESRSGSKGRPPTRRSAFILAFSLAAIALVAIPVLVSQWVGRPAGVEHTYEIPPGTAARVAAGEQVDVIPADLRLRPRDHLIVINHDDRRHQVGPITVEPGQRLERRLSDGSATAASARCIRAVA